jgi:hypothetical protein
MATIIVSGKKVNKVNIQGISEIVNQGGAVMASEWTNGAGRHTTKRGVPHFCSEIWADHAEIELKGEALKTAKRLIKKHPRVQKLIVCVDMRSAKRAIREMAKQA